MKTVIIAGMAVIAAAACSSATIAKDKDDGAETAQGEVKTKPKKICRTDARNTGTRISRPVCKTQDEWDAQEDGQEIGVRSKTSRADMDNVGGMNQP